MDATDSPVTAKKIEALPARSGILRQLLPWAITAVIFYFIFRRIPFSQMVEALSHARLLPYFTLLIPYSFLYFLIDSFCVTRVINWFNCPLPYRDILPVRAVTYLLSLVNTPLGQGGIALYLYRREKIPFLEVSSSVLFLVFVEFYQLVIYSFFGFLLFSGDIPRSFLNLYAVVFAYLFLHLLYFRAAAAPFPAVKSRPLLRAFRLGQVRHYLLLLLFKSPNFFMAVIVHYFALQFFGLHIPFFTLLAVLPLIFLVAALPVTVAHLGTSQAAWIFFLSAYGSEADLLAYSLTSHFIFMLSNGVIGLFFLPRAAREIFAPA